MRSKFDPTSGQQQLVSLERSAQAATGWILNACCDVCALRPFDQILRRSKLEETAGFKNCDSVAKCQRIGKVVYCHNGPALGSLQQIAQSTAHGLSNHRVQATQRFVQQQTVWCGSDRLGKCYAPPFSTGECAGTSDVVSDQMGAIGNCGRLHHSCEVLSGEAEGNVRHDSQVVVEGSVLGEQSDTPAIGGDPVHRVIP